MIPQIAYALENKPRTPVIWLHGLECTCCTESFIRSAHPLAKDAILSLISLDYDDTIMAAAGQQAEQALADVMLAQGIAASVWPVAGFTDNACVAVIMVMFFLSLSGELYHHDALYRF
ncbi:uptake hydrogenase small subunit [Salmonella enterica subsp. enterica serovar Paratyphi B str. ATCC 10719]|nr:uptake hydrogenase small subunit [Salmonella enterica subsp. enterica serovar Paratyphi B str. ATCC 10719]